MATNGWTSRTNAVLEDLDGNAKHIAATNDKTAIRADEFSSINIGTRGSEVAREWVAEAIAARGYPKPDPDDLWNHPMYRAIEDNPPAHGASLFAGHDETVSRMDSGWTAGCLSGRAPR